MFYCMEVFLPVIFFLNTVIHNHYHEIAFSKLTQQWTWKYIFEETPHGFRFLKNNCLVLAIQYFMLNDLYGQCSVSYVPFSLEHEWIHVTFFRIYIFSFTLVYKILFPHFYSQAYDFHVLVIVIVIVSAKIWKPDIVRMPLQIEQITKLKHVKTLVCVRIPISEQFWTDFVKVFTVYRTE